MGAQEEHTAHIWEHTEESTRRRAHRGEHTYERTQMRAYIWEHGGEHTDEPAQAKRTWTGDKSRFVWKFRKSARPRSRVARFVRACAVETHINISQEPFSAVIYRKRCRALLCPPSWLTMFKSSSFIIVFLLTCGFHVSWVSYLLIPVFLDWIFPMFEICLGRSIRAPWAPWSPWFPGGIFPPCHSSNVSWVWDFFRYHTQGPSSKQPHNEVERSTIVLLGKLTISMTVVNNYFDIARRYIRPFTVDLPMKYSGSLHRYVNVYHAG